MGYTRHNYIKRIRTIIEVYNQLKHHDVPDTFIVSKEFPKHRIYISYRQWMNIKGTPLTSATPALQNQMALFN
jgi:hypothetical protein